MLFSTQQSPGAKGKNTILFQMTREQHIRLRNWSKSHRARSQIIILHAAQTQKEANKASLLDVFAAWNIRVKTSFKVG
jgi:hypothetical protein